MEEELLPVLAISESPMDSTKPERIPKFLLKVYAMLEEKSFSNAITWTEDGRGVEIRDEHLLRENVLPVYFRHKNIASFIRQLNMYGFNRVNTESNRVIYLQPLFRKGEKDNLIEIKRKKSNKEKTGEASSVLNNSNQDMGIILKEMNKMKDNMKDYDERLVNLSKENKHLVQENEMLWDAVERAKNRQTFLAQKVQKILLFMQALKENSMKAKHLGNESIQLLETFDQPLLIADKNISDNEIQNQNLDVFNRADSLVERLKSSDHFLRSLEPEQKSKKRKRTEAKQEEKENFAKLHESLPSMNDKIEEVDRKRSLLPANSLALSKTNSKMLLTEDWDSLVPSPRNTDHPFSNEDNRHALETYLSIGSALDGTYLQQDSLLNRMNSLQSVFKGDDLLGLIPDISPQLQQQQESREDVGNSKQKNEEIS